MRSDEITGATFRRVDHLTQQLASLCNRTNMEVAHALLSSRTLRRHGYDHARQKGHLTETQGRAAIAVLEQWIGGLR